MIENIERKLVLLKIAGDNFCEIYSLLTVHCHDTDLIRITKNQLSLAFEMVHKSIQSESKFPENQDPISDLNFSGHN